MGEVRMKKCKLFVLSGLIYALVLGMFPCETTQAASIKLSKKSLSLNVGKSKTLKIKNLKKGQKVKWSSSKKKVATVSSKGKVTARKKGTATITATVKGKKYKCKLTVKGRKSTPKKPAVPTEKPAVPTEKPAVPTEKPIPTEKPVVYGNVTGNVSYYYNKYQGNKPDTGAKVILIPTDGMAKNMDLKSFSIYSDPSSYSNLEQYHFYVGEVDGAGNYTINHVASGNYKVLMISYKTSLGAWFDAYDESIKDAPTSYYDNIVGPYYPKYLKKETALTIGDSIGFRKYYRTEINVYENSTSTLSHDFGITYI